MIYKTPEHKIQSQSKTKALAQNKRANQSTFQFVDNRPEAIAQKNLQEMVNVSPLIKNQSTRLNSMTVNSSNVIQTYYDKEEFGGDLEELKHDKEESDYTKEESNDSENSDYDKKESGVNLKDFDYVKEEAGSDTNGTDYDKEEEADSY